MKIKTLKPGAMRLAAAFTRAEYQIILEPDVTIEDVLIPGYWMHNASQLKIFDKIDVIGVDFDITLRVREVGNGFVKVAMLSKWEDPETQHQVSKDEAAAIDALVPDGYVIDHHSKTGWRARLKDGAIEISRNHKTKADAIQSAVAHFHKSMGIAA